MASKEEEFPDIAVQDEDLLPVLEKATPDEMAALTELLRKKMRCELDESDNSVPAVVDAFQEMGVNFFALCFTGEGKPYKDIVSMVADKVDASLEDCESIEDMEWAIVLKVLEKAEEKLSAEEREELYQNLEDLSDEKTGAKLAGSLAKQAATHAVRLILVRVVAVQMMERAGLGAAVRFLAIGTAGRVLGLLAGPVGWAVSILWLLWDISGPAYTVMVPGVVLVAAMRIRQNSEDSANEVREGR